jgi:hypothetical protein
MYCSCIDCTGILTSVSDPDPPSIMSSMGSWIRIRIANTEPDPEGGKCSPQKEEKLSMKTRNFFLN